MFTPACITQTLAAMDQDHQIPAKYNDTYNDLAETLNVISIAILQWLQAQSYHKLTENW